MATEKLKHLMTEEIENLRKKEAVLKKHLVLVLKEISQYEKILGINSKDQTVVEQVLPLLPAATGELRKSLPNIKAQSISSALNSLQRRGKVKNVNHVWTTQG